MGFAIVTFALALWYLVRHDFLKWKKAQAQANTETLVPVNHKLELIRKALCMAPAYYFLLNFSLLNYFASAFIIASFFWLLFDGLFNKVRGFGWWFLGTIDIDESSLDNFQRKHGKALKIILIPISIILYIISLKLWV